MTKMI